MIWETRHHAVRGITLIMRLQTRKDMQGQQVVPESSSTQHQTVETSLSIFLMCWVVLRRPGSAVAQMTLEEVSQFGSVWWRLGYRPMELLGVIGTLGSEQEQEVEPLRMFPWRRNTLLCFLAAARSVPQLRASTVRHCLQTNRVKSWQIKTMR